MQAILEKRPDRTAQKPKRRRPDRARQPLIGHPKPIPNQRSPDYRNDPPRSFAERLQEISKQRCAVAALVVSRLVYLLQVEGFRKAATPHLHEQRSTEIQEPVHFVVLGDVGGDAEFLGRSNLTCRARCSRGRRWQQPPYWRGDVISVQEADVAIVEDLVCGFTVYV